MGFQRARSEEQRTERRESILAVTGDLLAELPVADITLTEISKRVGLAKSNVLRYFESREAVLLEVLARLSREWVDHYGAVAQVPPDGTVGERIAAVSATYARTAVKYPRLLGLLAAQAAVLERNVSTDVVLRFKRSVHATMADLAVLIGRALPELGDRAAEVCALTAITSGALYVQAEQSQRCAPVYAADPSLGVFRVELEPAIGRASCRERV